MSNSPAWYVAKVATLAAVRGMPGPIAMQYFYSLTNCDIEDEHVPLAAEFGMGMMPWSPLSFSLLAGKYGRSNVQASALREAGLPRRATLPGDKRSGEDKRLDGANSLGDSLFTDRNWEIVDRLKQVARDAEHGPAQVALAWITGRLEVAATLIGASKVEQVTANIEALNLAVGRPTCRDG